MKTTTSRSHKRFTHTANRATLKMWLGVSLLYLRQNIKPYTSYELRAELQILQKKILPDFQSVEPNSRLIEPDRIAQ